MKYRRYLALIIAATMTIGLSACSQASSESTVSAAESAAGNAAAGKAEQASAKTVTARVDSIDGNTINVTIGELGGGAPGDGSQPAGGQSGNMQTPPEKPEGQTGTETDTASGTNNQTPPEKPEGETGAEAGTTSGTNSQSASGQTSGQTPPEMPDGQSSSGQTPPDMPGSGTGGPGGNGQTPPDLPGGGAGGPGSMTISSMFQASEETAEYTIEESVLDGIALSDIKEGTILTIELDESGNITKVSEASMDSMMGGPGSNGQGGPGGAPGGQDASSIEYTAVTTYTEDAETTGENYTSTGTDENAILVDSGANVTIDGARITRESADSTGGDTSSFYGAGAAAFVKDGTLVIKNADIDTDAKGGAGVFAYGDGTAYVEDSVIDTKESTSGGIHVAGGGTLYAWNLAVTTNGESSAAIRSDRGGGTMVVDGGSYTSNGTGSPAIYTTADITVNDADLTATNSEAICIEGLNTLRLFDCDLTGNMPDSEQNDNTWTVIVYQSMSGDSEIGTGSFNMVGGTLTSKNGGLFYTTNTESEFFISDVDITYSEDNDFFLQVTGNANQRGWGQTGSNGAQCVFTAADQEMQGTIIYDSISTLDFYMTDESTLTGAFVDDETWAGSGGDGYCNVYVGKDSTWIVTEDSEIDALYTAGTIRDELGKTVSIVGTDGTTYVSGDSAYTITVSSYSTEDKSADALTEPVYS
ncbi:MAG: hypothetical protein J6E44_02180, partial [Lachnospiraceae bacterium]|nr:hypothetical protein [Lachnospiraceae bacterium]